MGIVTTIIIVLGLFILVVAIATPIALLIWKMRMKKIKKDIPIKYLGGQDAVQKEETYSNSRTREPRGRSSEQGTMDRNPKRSWGIPLSDADFD